MDNEFQGKPITNGSPKAGRLVIGILFVTLGAILLFGQIMGDWFISDFWPIFLIIGGLVFYAAYSMRQVKPPGFEGILFPGTYLIILGLLFLAMNLIGWQAMRYCWPTFVLAVAISLLVVNIFGAKNSGEKNVDSQSAIKILTILSIALYFVTIGGWKLWPLILVVVGVMILFREFGGKRKHHISEE